MEAGRGPRIEVTFLKKTKGAPKKSTGKGSGAKLAIGEAETGSKDFFAGAKGKKRKRGVDDVNEEGDGEEEEDRIEEDDDAMSLYADDDADFELDSERKSAAKTNASNASTSHQPASKSVQNRRSNHARVVESDEEDEYEDDWTFTMNVKSSKPAAATPPISVPKPKPKGAFTPHVKPLTGISGSSKTHARTPLARAKLPVPLNDVIQIISDSE